MYKPEDLPKLQELINKFNSAQGLGDIVETAIQAVGLDKLAPKGCGCKKRKEKLNEMFPIGENDVTNK